MLGAVLLLATFLAPSAPSSAQSDSVAIAAVIEEVEQANNRGDVERWVNLFATDFVYMASGSPAVTSREELRQVAQTGFRNKAAIDIRPVEIVVVGNWAFARSAVSGSVTLAGSGRVVTVDVKQLAVYTKTSAGWRIARLMINSNAS